MRNNTTKPQAAEATRGGIVTHKKRNVSSAIAMGTRLAMVSILEDVLLKRLLHADGFIRNRQHRVAQLQHKTHYMQIGHTGRSSDSLLYFRLLAFPWLFQISHSGTPSRLRGQKLNIGVGVSPPAGHIRSTQQRDCQGFSPCSLLNVRQGNSLSSVTCCRVCKGMQITSIMQKRS